MRILIIVMSVVFMSACQLGEKSKTTVSVDLYNTTSDMVGSARLTEDPDGVKIKVKAAGVTPGFHGIHIHEIAKCDAPFFKSAGNHFNPKDKEHGLMNAKGAHQGDLPNVEADDKGEIDEKITMDGATLLKGNTSLVEQGGSSIIITAQPDDGMTQISGDSGERIICGVIKSPNAKEDKDEEEAKDPTEED